MKRTQVLSLFLARQRALQASIGAVYSSFSFEVSVPGNTARQEEEHYNALVLARSSEYWSKRVHLQTTRPRLLLIVSEHDTCVPCAALDLSSNYLYAPRECPHWYSPEKRHGKRCHAVLVGQLLAHSEEGMRLLESLPRATQYRILSEVKAFMNNRQGRPLVA
jgi:hypothetical protein